MKLSVDIVCDLNRSSLTTKDVLNSIEYLDTSSITENTISSVQKLNIEEAPSRAKRKVTNNTIVYSTVRPNLKHFGILNHPKHNFIVSTGFTTIDIKKEFADKINPYYLYLLLSNQVIVNHLAQIADVAVSSYPSINPSDIGDLIFDFPDKVIQDGIVSQIKPLDQKISLNTRMNAELEAMAKQLYDYWFVQFDFPFDFAQGKPDENGKPYKSSSGKMVWNEKLKREIPEGWEVKKLSNILILEDYRRIPLSNKERENKKGPFPYYGATGIMDYVDEYIFDGDYLLLAEDGSTSDENGNPVVQYIWGKNWVNNHAHIITLNNKKWLEYCYFLLKTIPVVLIETGSIQKKINQENLMSHIVAFPPDKLIETYCNITNTFREKQKQVTDEKNHLTHLRDSLLPMLMNGQVTIE